MHRRLQHNFRPVTRVLLLAALVLAPLAARADTVASLLGNFTVNQYCGLKLTTDAVDVHYAVVFGQLPALRELHLADADGDGVTTQAERDAYIERLAPGFAQDLRLAVDGSLVALHALHWTSSLPTEQGGFSLRLDVDFTGVLSAAAGNTRHTLTFNNQNYPDQIGWNEITVQAPPSIAVFDTNAFSTSLTAGLTAAVQALPPTGPLAERSVHLTFVQGSAPLGAKVLEARAGILPSNAPPAAQRSSNIGESLWLQRQTKSLVDLISAPHVSAHVALLALLIALVLGAMHALSPGHGKTIVGAYLIGSRGTPRHALFLGVTVTVTHTVGVFVLGFATLVASRYVVPERLFPILSLISGLLVLGMGVFLLAQRWRAAQAHHHHDAPHSHAHADHHHDHHHHADHGHSDPTHAHQAHHAHSHDSHAHDEHEVSHHSHGYHHHSHEHPGEQDHVHQEPGRGVSSHAPGTTPGESTSAFTHSHGGRAHSHLPPGTLSDSVSWRSLLALGISGGLVPCPSAMVLLLAAVALNKTAYGLVLVVAFSVGLATTLTLVGLTFLYARNRFRTPAASSRWPQLLPVASAAAITLIGAVLSLGAMQSIFSLR